MRPKMKGSTTWPPFNGIVFGFLFLLCIVFGIGAIDDNVSLIKHGGPLAIFGAAGLVLAVLIWSYLAFCHYHQAKEAFDEASGDNQQIVQPESPAAVPSPTPAAAKGQCLQPPIGCGKPITDFPTATSAQIYKTTGLCPSCQDKVLFRSPPLYHPPPKG